MEFMLKHDQHVFVNCNYKSEMGLYEKAIGYVVIPFLLILLVLLATGIFRR